MSADRRARAVTDRLADYFAGRLREPGFGLPIDWRLTSNLQRRVLRCLEQTVPFGETITYGGLAERCGGFDPELARSGQAARLVGTIKGSCPIAILIPAHRVVAAGRPRRLRQRAGCLAHEALAAHPRRRASADPRLGRPGELT